MKISVLLPGENIRFDLAPIGASRLAGRPFQAIPGKG
jgi:hypothetical protein